MSTIPPNRLPAGPDRGPTSLWTATIDVAVTVATTALVAAAVIELLRSLAGDDNRPDEQRIKPFRTPVSADQLQMPVA